MADTSTAPGAANFVAGEWTTSRAGRTYERHEFARPAIQFYSEEITVYRDV